MTALSCANQHTCPYPLRSFRMQAQPNKYCLPYFLSFHSRERGWYRQTEQLGLINSLFLCPSVSGCVPLRNPLAAPQIFFSLHTGNVLATLNSLFLSLSLFDQIVPSAFISCVVSESGSRKSEDLWIVYYKSCEHSPRFARLGAVSNVLLKKCWRVT